METNNSNRKPYSQLRAMLAISRASLRSTLRSPSAVVFTLAFPMVFIVVFGFIGGGGFKVHVGLDKGSDLNNPVYFALANNKTVRLTQGASEKETQEKLSKGDIDAIIKINKGATAQGMPQYNVDLVTSASTAEKGRVIALMLKEVSDSLSTRMTMPYQAALPPPIVIHTSEASLREYKNIDFILPGQLGFSLLSTGVFGTAFVFLSLRQTLVIKRFFATPVNRMYIVLGEALARLVFALFGALIIIIIGHWAFDFTLIHGFTTVLEMLLLSALGLIVFMGFGFTISGIAKNESTVPPLANIVTLPQFLLAGTFFSIDVFPAWLQPIARILPLAYLNDAMRKVAFEGTPLWELWPQIGVLLLWGVVIYFAASRVFRWE